MFGLQYQPRLEAWIGRSDVDIDCVEVRAELFDTTTFHHLRWLSSRIPVAIRSNALSLGGPDPIDARRLASCEKMVRDSGALWLSHPLGFSRAGEIDLGLTMPIAPTPANVDLVSERASLVMQRCGATLLFEPNASRLEIRGTLRETEFLGRLCSRCGGGLLIDLSVLMTVSRLRRFNPVAWLDDLDPSHVARVRVGARADDETADPLSGPAFAVQLSLLSHLRSRCTLDAVVLVAPRSWTVDDVNGAFSRLRDATA